MKHFLAILFSFAVLIVSGREGASSLRFDATTHDFGTIREQNGEVKYKFGFVNDGQSPIVIESVETSCGCTTPSYSRAPVLPGKRGEITIAYDPTGRPGMFAKEIVVRSGNGTNYDKLNIKGSVTPRPRTVSDDYPFELMDGVRFTGAFLSFDRVGQGTAKSMTLGYVNTGRKSADIVVAAAKKRPQFKVTSPGAVCAGCKGEVTVTYDLTQGQMWGRQTDDIDILVNGKKTTVPITASAVFVDNFGNAAKSSDAPKAKFNALFHHFGDVGGQEQLSKKFQIDNTGNATLIVRHVDCSPGVTTTIKAGDRIEPGKALVFNTTLSPEAARIGTRAAGNVSITLNDPMLPLREVRLVGNIVDK